MSKKISGFSKLTKEEKIEWLVENYFNNNSEIITIIKQYWNNDKDLQLLHDDFIENTISNFYMFWVKNYVAAKLNKFRNFDYFGERKNKVCRTNHKNSTWKLK